MTEDIPRHGICQSERWGVILKRERKARPDPGYVATRCDVVKRISKFNPQGPGHACLPGLNETEILEID